MLTKKKHLFGSRSQNSSFQIYIHCEMSPDLCKFGICSTNGKDIIYPFLEKQLDEVAAIFSTGANLSKKKKKKEKSII